MDSLTPEIRLLSLFKFWNVVESFYPYKDNFTEDWSRVLSEFIPVVCTFLYCLIYVTDYIQPDKIKLPLLV